MPVLPPLLKRGPLALAYSLHTDIFPLVDEELDRWKEQAALSPDEELKKQALASIRHKRFHALGGSFYALYRGEDPGLLRFITAFQTISDYLDNLCDRAGVLDERAFRRLHEAMLDALSPEAPPKDYYQHYPHRQDGGYLESLVRCCQEYVAALPAYPRVKEDVLYLTSLYCDLQVYKHLLPEKRVSRLEVWHEQKCPCPGLFWWEFAAAGGSTLGVFALVAAASGPGLEDGERKALVSGYFPFICGLHILLDYYIDQAEDRREGDLNLVAFYRDEGERLQRLLFFAGKALVEAGKLPRPAFHRLAVQGLLAMYLSDPKVKAQGLEDEAGLVLQRGGMQARTLHALCRGVRRRGLL